MLRQGLIHFSSVSCWLEDLTRRREERGEDFCSPPSWHPDCSLIRLRFPTPPPRPETLRLVGKVLLYSVRKSGHSQRCNDTRSPSRWGLVQGMDYIMIERSHSGFSRWKADLRKEGLPGRGCNFSNHDRRQRQIWRTLLIFSLLILISQKILIYSQTATQKKHEGITLRLR